MNILEMTENELYEAGLKELITQMGAAYMDRFLQQCKPNDYDHTAERHKWLDDDPDIPTMVKRIQERKTQQETEARVTGERIEAWRKGLLELTDIEIYELGAKVLTDKLGVPGSIGFLRHHFKQNENPLPQQPMPDKDTRVIPNQQTHAAEPRD